MDYGLQEFNAAWVQEGKKLGTPDYIKKLDNFAGSMELQLNSMAKGSNHNTLKKRIKTIQSKLSQLKTSPVPSRQIDPSPLNTITGRMGGISLVGQSPYLNNLKKKKSQNPVMNNGWPSYNVNLDSPPSREGFGRNSDLNNISGRMGRISLVGQSSALKKPTIARGEILNTKNSEILLPLLESQISVFRGISLNPLRHLSQFEPWVISFGFPKDTPIRSNNSWNLPVFTRYENELRVELEERAGIVGIDTVGDGSCLLHSFFMSLSPTYRNVSRSNKMIIVDRFRRTDFYNLFLENVQNGKINGYKNDRSIVESYNYLGYLENNHAVVFANTYRINIIVLSTNLQDTSGGSKRPTHLGALYSDDQYIDPSLPHAENMIQSNFSRFTKNGYPFIFLVNHGQGHFSSVFLDNYKRFMMTEDEVISRLPVTTGILGIGDNTEKTLQAKNMGRPPPGKLTEGDIIRELNQVSSRLHPVLKSTTPVSAPQPKIKIIRRSDRIASLVAMGFNKNKAAKALNSTRNNVSKAAAILLSNKSGGKRKTRKSRN